MGDGNILQNGSTMGTVEKDGKAGLRHTVLERVFRLLQLLLINECTRLEIFEHLTSDYPKVL